MGDDHVKRHWAGNRLLQAIPAVDRPLLQQSAEFVELARGQVLFEAGQDVAITHFPLRGAMAGLVIALKDGRTTEAASIGQECAVGGIVSAGHKPAFARAIMQIAGPAIRIETAQIEAAKLRSAIVRDIFSRFADSLVAQLLQSVACNVLHPLPQRLARWLLTTRDRTTSDELPLTQEYLGQMVGAHRSTVIRAVRALQSEGAIRSRRGRLTVVNRARLEQASCECYRAVARHYDRILGPTEP